MSVIRYNPIDQSSVIISEKRTSRPSDYRKDNRSKQEDTYRKDCPFCKGNEDMTPREVYSVSHNSCEVAGAGDWVVRVVPNKYGIFSNGNEAERNKSFFPYSDRTAKGYHEVVIETPKHGKSLGDLEPSEILNVLSAFKHRITCLSDKLECGYVAVFKNHGTEAGASLKHSHSQIIALSLIPERIERQIEAGISYYRGRKSCIICDTIAYEIKKGLRIVRETEQYVMMVPYWSGVPFEVSIVPKNHSYDYTAVTGVDLNELSHMLAVYLSALKRIGKDIPYNIMLFVSPVDKKTGKYDNELFFRSFHWHIMILPRINKIAGFELLTGIYINTQTPENSAKILRNKIQEMI